MELNGPRCWGIGLGRTGTNTLCAALRTLGYVRVKHNPLFEELAQLDGGADNGVTVFYKYLDYKFPGSKFVLTTREMESWLESMDWAAKRFSITPTDDVPIMRRMLMYESVVFDRQRFIDAYRRHHADVRRYFANRPGDLLEMDVIRGAGWETLCPFLGASIPEQPFPHLFAREQGGCELGPGFDGSV